MEKCRGREGESSRGTCRWIRYKGDECWKRFGSTHATIFSILFRRRTITFVLFSSRLRIGIPEAVKACPSSST
jgi:hypothetical protein